ncbi:autotransporter outer membrane beta-barrel domain-containing protein [Xanthobacter aminoxidans]|uniref:autotransporter outer membrane beta-barrel domain-containing protein n=1 Tax=Xanthobacter aminoxidans TaxID=186280 RepID=UPI002022C00E|nr:autotransporter domain-containing protein [Xanthobacter aminoxidans]MCL8381049.1 autotransporter domain-containing protein [Xanthobacter aminoxidans]
MISRSSIALAALLSSVSFGALETAQAHEFSNFYVFGDSLSDAGTYYVVVDGQLQSVRFTVNPGQVWDMRVGEHYGIDVSPYLAIDTVSGTSTVVGGTNYAQGGACVDSGYNIPKCVVYPSNTLGETQQLQTYLASTGGVANPNALYSMWAGANDVFSQAILWNGGAETKEQAIANVATAADQHVANIATLSRAGARYIIVPNLPDISKAPVTGILGDAAFFSEAVTTYNTTLNQDLRRLGGSNIIFVDDFALLNEVIANPAMYGFTNVTSKACTQLFSLTCTANTLVAPNAQNDYLFADIVHPTPAGHALLAEYIESIIDAPGLIGMLAESPIYVGRGIYRTLDTRIGTGTPKGFQLYTNIDYSTYSLDPTRDHSGSDGSATAGYVGLEYGFGNGISVGALLSYASGSYNFSALSGGYDADMFNGTIYANARFGGAFAQLSGTMGSIDYNSIQRQFALGAALRTDMGNTSGIYYGARLATGYDFTFGQATLTPLAQLTYQQATVDGYAETAGNSSAMSFGNQLRELFYVTLGGQASYAFVVSGVTIRPNVQASWNYDFLNQDRSVTAGLLTAPVTFAMPVYQPGRAWTNLAAGLTVEAANGLSCNFTVGEQLGQDQVSSAYVNGGIVYKF